MQEQVPTARFITTFGGAVSYAIAVTVMSFNIFLIFAEENIETPRHWRAYFTIGDDACDISYILSLCVLSPILSRTQT